MESRKIKNRGGPDILRWGKETKGTFTIKEAYNIKIKQAQAEEEQNWRKLWKNKWWSKIQMFAWLVGRKRIITWDQLQKRGFSGPPRCSLCNQDGDKETGVSTSGYAMSLGSGAVSWRSRKQSVPADSTTEAEYVAVAEATKEIVWLRKILEDLQVKQVQSTRVMIDNTSAIKLAKNPKFCFNAHFAKK